MPRISNTRQAPVMIPLSMDSALRWNLTANFTLSAVCSRLKLALIYIPLTTQMESGLSLRSFT